MCAAMRAGMQTTAVTAINPHCKSGKEALLVRIVVWTRSIVDVAVYGPVSNALVVESYRGAPCAG
jgi:hypothetical protein